VTKLFRRIKFIEQREKAHMQSTYSFVQNISAIIGEERTALAEIYVTI